MATKGKKIGTLALMGLLAGLAFRVYKSIEEVRNRVTRFELDRVMRRDQVHPKEERYQLYDIEDYHPTVERITNLDRSFREELNTNNDRIVSREEFSQFLDVVGYNGRRIGDEERHLQYGFCDNPVRHGHSGTITLERRIIHFPSRPKDGVYYDLDPSVVEDYLRSE